MGGRSLGLAKQRLVPLEAAGHIANANDRPRAFHRISAVGPNDNWMSVIFIGAVAANKERRASNQS
jgi:hypothetical protein